MPVPLAGGAGGGLKDATKNANSPSLELAFLNPASRPYAPRGDARPAAYLYHPRPSKGVIQMGWNRENRRFSPFRSICITFSPLQ